MSGCDQPDVPPRVVSPSSTVADENGWPQMFGPHHDSSSSEQGLIRSWAAEGPPELWRCAAGEGYSVPIVQDNRLVLFHRVADEEVIACLDATTGEALWDFRYPTSYKCKYAYSSGPYSTPVMEGNRVWTIGAEGKMHCLSLDRGEVLWRRDLNADYELKPSLFAVGAAPLLDGDLLIMNIGGSGPASGIIAMDSASGETLWTATDDGPAYCTPKQITVKGNRYVLVLTLENLVCLDPENGTVTASYPFQAKAVDSVNATSPLVVGDIVFIASGPGPGCRCLRVSPEGTFSELWGNRRAIDSQFNNLVHVDGYVYGYTSKWNRGATFNCVDLMTGEVKWRYESDLMRGSSLRIGDHFILWGELGHLASLRIDPREARMVCMTREPLLAAPCFTAPALDQGRLYLRNEKHLICLDLRPQEASKSGK
jgi:outer membrane protein assembly factor BamB